MKKIINPNKPMPPPSAKRVREIHTILTAGLTGLLGEYKPDFQRRVLTEYLAELDHEEARARAERQGVKWTG